MCQAKGRAELQSESTKASTVPNLVPRETEALPNRIGRYVVLGRLGEGGMGTVYAAYHPELDRKVALKVLRSDVASTPEAESYRARLVREAQAMARLGHPNVVAVHDVGSDDGLLSIVMELVEGESLADRLLRGPIPVSEGLSILTQAARGLQAAHRAGLIHRDFKPANILLSTDGRVRVADFGIAQHQERPEGAVGGATAATPEALTQWGAITGTPSYMAPEQFDGAPASQKTDQFSFCVTAFEVLYGQRPFDREAPPSTRYTKLAPMVSRGEPRFVKAAVLKGLSVKPDDRFETFDELVAQLSRQPITAGRVVPWVGLGVALAGCLAVLVVANQPPVIAGCSAAERDLQSTWGSEHKAVLRQAFEATGLPEAAAAASTIEQTLDAYLAQWSNEAVATCQLAQREPLSLRHTNRLACLNQQRLQVKALVEVLGHPTAAMIAQGPMAASALVPSSRCAEPNIFAALPRTPEDPAIRDEVSRIRFDVATSLAFNLAGVPSEAAARLPKLEERAKALKFKPLEAEVAYALAETHAMNADGRLGLEASRGAALAALESGLDLLAADSMAVMAFNSAYSEKLDLADELIAQASALLTRAGGDAMVASRIENDKSVLFELRGDLKGALAASTRAYQLRKQAWGPKHPRTLSFLSNLGISYIELCQADEAVELLRVFDSPADIPHAVGTYSDGLLHLAEALLMTDQLDEAERVARMSQSAAKTFSAVKRSEKLTVLANVQAARGEFEVAISNSKEALQLARSQGEDWINYSYSLGQLANVLAQAGHYDEALTLFAQLRDKKSPDAEWSRLLMAVSQLETKKFAEAVKTIAVMRADTARCLMPKQAAQLDVAEARALAGVGQDSARVTELVSKARQRAEGKPWAAEVLQPLARLPVVAERRH